MLVATNIHVLSSVKLIEGIIMHMFPPNDIDLLKCSIVPGFNRDDADNDAVGTHVHAEVYLVDAVFDAGTDGVDVISN